MTLKMPSSVSVGSRPPSSFLIFSYSSGVSPCCRIVSGEMAGVKEVGMGRNFYCRIVGCSWDRAAAKLVQSRTGSPARISGDDIHCGGHSRAHVPRQNGGVEGL